MTNSFKSSALALAISAAFASSVALADGRVTGRVADQSGQFFFEGAQVRIDALNMQTATGEDGRFSLNAVPAGTYELSVSYLGAEKVTQEVVVVDDQASTTLIKIGDDVRSIENVLVVGQSAFVNRAINQMRTSDNLKSVITSDAIGQLPDENVSEALQRVPGVFIERDQGEGRYVGIRGIDSNLNLASINGVAIASPESDRRSVALDVIPSDLVESIEVTKTLNADMDAQAIGGAINIKSLSAFDRDGLFYKVSGNTNYSELQEESGYKVSGSLTNIFELSKGELGVAVAFSSQERKFGSENIETDGSWENEDPAFHEEVEARDYEVTRERDGFALNLDYRLSEDTLFYSRYLYSEFGDQEYRNRFEYKLDEGDGDPTTSTNIKTDTEVQRELKDRFEEQEIQSLLLGAETQISAWKLEGKVGYSEASESEPNRIDSVFENDAVAEAGYLSLGETPNLYISEDGLNPENYYLKEIEVIDNLAEDETFTFNFDAKYELNFGSHPGFIKLGVAMRNREKTNDSSATLYEGDFFEDNFTWQDFAGSNVDYGLGSLGPAINAARVRAMLAENAAFLNDEDNDAIDTDARTLAGLNDYTIEEDISAAYIMSQIDIDDLRLTYGIRVEQTDVTATGIPLVEGNESQIEDVRNTTEHDYTHVLPSINARYNLNEDKVLRASYFQSIGRPSFGALNPTFEAENDGGDFVAEEVGNPNLEPFESHNVDVSFDYYPGGIGVISVGAFYKSIENFIFLGDITDSVNLENFLPADVIADIAVVDEFVQYQNGGDASIIGLEFAYTKAFENGFLVQFNTTLSESEADYPVEDREDDDLPLVNQSDVVSNIVLGYEKDAISLRLSTAYQSKRLMELGGDEDGFNDLYEDAHTQVDFSSKYEFNDNVQVFFNAKNLTDEPFYAYRGNKARNGQYEEYGVSFELGITLRNK